MYLKSLKKTSAKPFETMFPAADPDAIDLLKRMLQFNPNKRCTAEEALDHDFLKSVRRKELEVRKMILFFNLCQISFNKLT